jgi:hypothetical protein
MALAPNLILGQNPYYIAAESRNSGAGYAAAIVWLTRRPRR